MNRQLLFKLMIVLALTGLSFSFNPKVADATQICAIACSNAFPGVACSSISCRCDAAAGAIKKCTQCSDNDYTCPGQCATDPFGNYQCN